MLPPTASGTPILLRDGDNYRAGKVLITTGEGKRETYPLDGFSFKELMDDAWQVLEDAGVPFPSVGIYTYFSPMAYAKHR